MNDPKLLKREIANLKRQRRQLLKLAEDLLDVAQAGGAVSRDCYLIMVQAEETIAATKSTIRTDKARAKTTGRT